MTNNRGTITPSPEKIKIRSSSASPTTLKKLVERYEYEDIEPPKILFHPS